MKKAIVKIPSDNKEKVAASDFLVQVHHKGGNVVDLPVISYTYEDVFEHIVEKYEHDLDFIQKITIEVKR